jgi:hypothetical protein
MKKLGKNLFKMRNLTTILMLTASFVLYGSGSQALAHGGEDHGDEKPKTQTTTAGTVTRTTKIGDLEITLKNPALEPDAVNSARLFVTKFATNEAFGDIVPKIEIESANGTITQIAVEKTETAGSFNLKIPALPEGKYTIRTSLKISGGNNTATFSDVEVSHPATETAAGDGTFSWLYTTFLFLVGAVVLGLFGVLFYLAWRIAVGKQVEKETVSA